MSGSAHGPTKPPSQWVLRDFSQGVKPPACEADHLPPSSGNINNEESFTSLARASSVHVEGRLLYL